MINFPAEKGSEPFELILDNERLDQFDRYKVSRHNKISKMPNIITPRKFLYKSKNDHT